MCQIRPSLTEHMITTCTCVIEPRSRPSLDTHTFPWAKPAPLIFQAPAMKRNPPQYIFCIFSYKIFGCVYNLSIYRLYFFSRLNVHRYMFQCHFSYFWRSVLCLFSFPVLFFISEVRMWLTVYMQPYKHAYEA